MAWWCQPSKNAPDADQSVGAEELLFQQRVEGALEILHLALGGGLDCQRQRDFPPAGHLPKDAPAARRGLAPTAPEHLEPLFHRGKESGDE